MNKIKSILSLLLVLSIIFSQSIALAGSTEVTLTFSANGGSGVPSTQYAEIGETITIPSSPRPSRTGYSFKGYSTSSTATSASYQPGGSIKMNSNRKLYAVWSINRYTFTFNANGGYGAPSSISGDYNSTVTIPVVVPQRTGYNFQGWGTSSTTTTVSYTIGGNYTITSSKTLYAVWVAKPICTLSFSANGGSGAPPSIQDYQGASVPIPSSSINRTGYSFLGWSTSSTATAATYRTNDNFPLLCDQTLYAVWSINRYTFTFDANGGYGAPSSISGDYNSTVTIPVVVPQRTGYNFQGWGTSSTNTTVSYTIGGNYTITSSKTLYAVWVAKPICTLSFSANGGSGAPPSIQDYQGASVPIPSSSINRTGYSFLGWSTSSTATAATYRTNDNFPLLCDQTLYAIWSIKRYEFSFDANGGFGAPPSVYGDYNTSVMIPIVVPQRDGYTFEGWGTDTSTATYFIGTYYTITSSLKLYAVWKVRPKCTLSFDYNGGSIGPSSIIEYRGQPISLPNELPVFEGQSIFYQYIFTGWSESRDNSTNKLFQPGQMYVMVSDTILYAIWRKPRMIYHLDGGRIKEPDNGYYIGEDTFVIEQDDQVTYHVKDAEKLGYYVMGYYGDDGNTYFVNSGYNSGRDVNLEVYWAEDSFDIIYTGGQGGVIVQHRMFNETFNLPTQSSNEYYDFAGWFDAEEKMLYAGGAQYTCKARNTDFSAQWTPKVYTIDLYTDGGITSNYHLEKTPGEALALPGEGEITKSGHRFTGWKDVNGQICASPLIGELPLVEGAGTRKALLYAMWDKITDLSYYLDYDVSLSGKTVTVNYTTKNMNVGDTILLYLAFPNGIGSQNFASLSANDSGTIIHTIHSPEPGVETYYGYTKVYATYENYFHDIPISPYLLVRPSTTVTSEYRVTQEDVIAGKVKDIAFTILADKLIAKIAAAAGKIAACLEEVTNVAFTVAEGIVELPSPPPLVAGQVYLYSVVFKSDGVYIHLDVDGVSIGGDEKIASYYNGSNF